MKYTPGMTVRIRNWDDMKDEFGIIGNDIDCPFLFTPPMSEYCGRVYSIRQVEHDSWDGNGTQRLFFEEEDGIENYWVSAEMVESFTSESIPEIVDTSKLTEFLNSFI